MLLVFPSVLLLCLCPGESLHPLLSHSSPLPLSSLTPSSPFQELYFFFIIFFTILFSVGVFVWCSTYSVLKLCVDTWARGHWCSGVGTLVDDFFKDVHLTYFSECGRIQDPPVTALVLMVAPLVISTLLLPILCVYLTTRKQE
uniref:Uncharacterized protein n=1 Tax=Periophthalmus magnuspinnatus TaxID=409849 RepID=A0A3B4A784_9GOBI